MGQLILLGLLSPLMGFLFLLVGSHLMRRKTIGRVACGTIAISFICFATLLSFTLTENVQEWHLPFFQWLPVQGINASFTLHIDALSLSMALIITGVGFLIHVYSMGYIEHENSYGRYFAYLNFFVFAMLLLVLAGDLVLLFVGWEGVGLASYLLIGFWYEKPSATRAATKAFVVNRIGDLGLLIGLLLTFRLFGTSDIPTILQQASQDFSIGAPAITLLTFLYFIGVSGKSAQIPLHVWLPDAMEGPTPVSALIHAATMVTAGVYLIVRLHPLFLLAPTTLLIIGAIGAATALFAALSALAQIDLKRVLAYSTMSQLGYMFLACGVGSFYGAMFHLTMHAFIKALLFLSAGNVIHRMHDETDMRKMGGLSKVFKKTHWLFLIGVLALSGIPPLAAFFSKDLILEEAYRGGFKTLFYVGLLASFLTAFYMVRAYCLTFSGALQETNKHLKEVRSVMIAPLIVLAFFSIFGGFIGFSMTPPSLLESLLAKVGIAETSIAHHHSSSWTIGVSIAAALLGLSGAALLYTRHTERLGKPLEFLKNAFYFDNCYSVLFVRPLKAFSRRINTLLEPHVFAKSIELTARMGAKIAGCLQLMQSGQLRSYVAWMALGAVFLMAYFMF
ncbi:NADH-quinone oxidoreductase subunit L [Chlamydiales bacterium STE3]|nr:NADH-quinone oxidoreductase subunit L [Chlamydiales bacterium STE3]